jgi:hypothetical protein
MHGATAPVDRTLAGFSAVGTGDLRLMSFRILWDRAVSDLVAALADHVAPRATAARDD